ncbi:MAG: phosphotransferase [Actinobacteria bacterium]|nr:phosphotransferase [Actinomycetota bacterium]
MRWPSDSPSTDRVLADALLADAVGAADAWLPDLQARSVLRHVPGRRITALATLGDAEVVVKVFHSPRARGNHRRLTALAAAGLTDLVPASLGHDPTGRVGVIEFRPGIVLDQVSDEDFIAAARRAGGALRRLHDCDADLDREWTLPDEVDALRRRATDDTRPFVDTMLRCLPSIDPGPAVPSHRDCHPRQLVVDGSSVHWIDLDDCTLAPAGLDVGNMAAHLTREGVLGRRSRAVADEARAGFIAGYRWDRSTGDLARWELLSLARLAGLAESRHRSTEERDALLHEATRLLIRFPADDARKVPA